MPLKPDTRVLITAGASGIGQCIAAMFDQRGAKVHVCDNSSRLLAEFSKSHPNIVCTLTDVAESDQVTQLYKAVENNWGGLDVLVNNAGIAGPTATVDNITSEQWNRTLAVNISGQFYCVREAVPLFKKSGGGVIINMSSIAGRMAFPLRTPYAASKWAVIGFTKSLAVELGSNNIRVNAILPGAVEGDRFDDIVQARASEKGLTVDQMRNRFLEQISLKKFATVEDIAAMAVYLASDEGRVISGQTIGICGNTEYVT